MKIQDMVTKLENIIDENDRKNHICINMTNGIEALSFLTIDNLMFCNIQSTHLEQKLYDDILTRLGADFLMKLALGHNLYVVDFGTNKDCSRAIYQGVPFIKYVLERVWFDKNPKQVFIYPRSNKARGINVARDFDHRFHNLSKSTLRYIKKFRAYAQAVFEGTDRNEVNLIGVCASTKHDGDQEFYVSILRNWECGNENFQTTLRLLDEWGV